MQKQTPQTDPVAETREKSVSLEPVGCAGGGHVGPCRLAGQAAMASVCHSTSPWRSLGPRGQPWLASTCMRFPLREGETWRTSGALFRGTVWSLMSHFGAHSRNVITWPRPRPEMRLQQGDRAAKMWDWGSGSSSPGGSG